MRRDRDASGTVNLLELARAPSVALHGLGGTIVVARVLHAVGLYTRLELGHALEADLGVRLDP